MTRHTKTGNALAPTTMQDVRKQWASAADGWRRWEPHFAMSSWPVTVTMMSGLGLKPGMKVLDVGCGIGDPALPVATVVGPRGRVLALDVAPEMIEIAQSRARQLKLKQVEFQVGAIEDLDPDAESFDAVISRFTIMFLLDLPGGLERMLQLLKPGGRVAVSTWAHMDINEMFAIPSQEFAKVVDLPKPPRGSPGPMRLSKPGQLEQALVSAGFSDVRTSEVPMYNFAQDPESYFEMVYDMAPMFKTTFDGLSEDQQNRVREGILTGVARHADQGVIRVPATARVGTATKPAA